MKVITEDAKLVCAHVLGKVGVRPSQALVTIAGRRVLAEPDPAPRPLGWTVAGCPNIGATIKPCQHTVNVEAGYSTFVRIEGKRICLDTVSGLTDGSPPGIVKYSVADPGQVLVSEGA